MKALFINPPTWFNMFPPLALPILAGYLDTLGHKTKVYDLNIEFFHYIFSGSFINKFINLYNELKQDITENIPNSADVNKEKKITIFNDITNYAANNSFDISKAQEYCNKYKEICNDINLYFNSWEIKVYHYKIIVYCEVLRKLQIIYPNILKEFFDKEIDKILNFEADYIGFSMNDLDQFLYSIQIAKQIKKIKKVPICFGGTCMSYSYDKKIKNKVGFHKNVADFVMFGSGELPHEDMANFIDGKIDISEVRNIEYLDNYGNIKRNISKITGLIPKYYTKYDDLDFSKYFTPQMVLSVETTKGCYWNKCAFCTRASFHSGYLLRKVSDVVDDIEHLSKKYKVKYFHIMDDCIPVAYAEKLAQTIIDRNLEVYYMTFMRFEDNMTKEFLQKLYDSGMRLIIWGLESPNQERLNYINKGLNIESVKRILKDAADIGIKNNVTFIVDFPNESKNELKYTLNFINEYSDYIYFAQIHQFILMENTPMFDNPIKYNISQEYVEKTKINGFARNSNPELYEKILENISIKSMMKGAPPLCLYTTGGSLFYSQRDNILQDLYAS